MSVLRKEYYTQLNGVEVIKVILTPTKVFSNGYFYAPREAESLIDSFCWYLSKSSKNRLQVVAGVNNEGTYKNYLFHKELFRFYHGYDCQEDIDHFNMIEFDNIDQNLNAVSHQQNQFNHFTKGYLYHKGFNHFQARYKLNGRNYYPFSITHKEDEACTQANHVDQVILREELGDEYYRFDFLKYRRDSEDILDLERQGIISEEEATYQHILRYSNNAWYYLRFGLQDYFEQNNIPVPKYDLDENGFMIDINTRQRLCPFYKEGR